MASPAVTWQAVATRTRSPFKPPRRRVSRWRRGTNLRGLATETGCAVLRSLFAIARKPPEHAAGGTGGTRECRTLRLALKLALPSVSSWRGLFPTALLSRRTAHEAANASALESSTHPKKNRALKSPNKSQVRGPPRRMRAPFSLSTPLPACLLPSLSVPLACAAHSPPTNLSRPHQSPKPPSGALPAYGRLPSASVGAAARSQPRNCRPGRAPSPRVWRRGPKRPNPSQPAAPRNRSLKSETSSQQPSPNRCRVQLYPASLLRASRLVARVCPVHPPAGGQDPGNC